jgi:hypothetical protein
MGSSGHLPHPFEDASLSIGDLRNIVLAASRGELEDVTEKPDGTEFIFTWCEHASAARAARNMSDIRSGGVDVAAISHRFAEKAGLATALSEGLRTLSAGLCSLSETSRSELFGLDGTRWYAAEVMHTAWTRTISYTGNNIVLHERPTFVRSMGTGEITRISTTNRALVSHVATIRKGLATSWQLHEPGPPHFDGVPDVRSGEIACERLDAALRSVCMRDDATVAEFTAERLRRALKSSVHEANLRDSLVERLLHRPGAASVRSLMKTAGTLASVVKVTIENEKMMLDEAVGPLEEAVRGVAVALLRRARSRFVADPVNEATRLRCRVSEAIASLRHNRDHRAQVLLSRLVPRLGAIEDLSAIEGIVFTYRGRPYKMTGAFAAANRLISFAQFGASDDA